MASRAPSKKEEATEVDDDEPSTLRKTIYAYLAFALLHAEFA